ncbi:MAG: hypothetical protein ACRDZX_04100 [Acidimicrobiales bacterium]
MFMRGIVPGRNHTQRTRAPELREIVLSEQEMLRSFLADTAASVRGVYSGPIIYAALPVERVDWEHFDIVDYYRQSRQGITDDQYLAKIREFRASDNPVVITEFGFATCRDMDDPVFLGTFNATTPSLLGLQLPVIGQRIQSRVRTVHSRDEQAQSRLLVEQLGLLDQACVEGRSPPYSEDPRHDIDATALSIVSTLPRGQRGATYPEMAGEPKQAFHAVADYYATH